MKGAMWRGIYRRRAYMTGERHTADRSIYNSDRKMVG